MSVHYALITSVGRRARVHYVTTLDTGSGTARAGRGHRPGLDTTNTARAYERPRDSLLRYINFVSKVKLHVIYTIYI